ncbi:hypothetical protein CAPTEDRAFT_228569 [Capitella teleta]|uniref:Peptidase metallopeptidase domain-containing protein n=1 Tax=Capitella teleta TaxID=283909 RepID=R7V761_CAPTE|nr:hypothetical protein CAPTEDRAFT_228569 [Capitella teleta]|eukprot:ELU14292.1 hypothetical protein CAPTEDRAFT_228569 [Capitella teleta]
MKHATWVLVAMATCCVTLVTAAAVPETAPSREEIEEFMTKYGYTDEVVDSEAGTSPSKVGALVAADPEEKFRQKIRLVQRMGGLEETGELNEETIKLFKTKRCGMVDYETGNMVNLAKRRRKRYALEGSRWADPERLTWKLSRGTNDMSSAELKSEIQRAFDVWAEYSSIEASETSSNPDINVAFYTGNHGDGYPFDGRGTTLAHAFFPRWGGDVHFDDDETFTRNSYSGTNFFQVAAHEIGHSLGLMHSSDQSSLMAAYYRGYQRNFKLGNDDIRGIQNLYPQKSVPAPTRSPASNTTPGKTTPRTTSGGTPDYCQNARFDTITIYDGDVYGFLGNLVYLLTTSGVAAGYPKSISSSIFKELPNNLDSSVYWEESTKGQARTYFFKGSQYWRYNSNGLANGYPRSISRGFPGVPNNLDASFVWSGNDVTYFIKDNQYYRYVRGSGVTSGYPRPLSLWAGLPSNIDAAFQYTNGRTYFFSGTTYYRFNDFNFRVDDSYPRNNNYWWYGCRSGNLVEGLSNDTEERLEEHLEENTDDDEFVEVPTHNVEMRGGYGLNSAPLKSSAVSVVVALLAIQRIVSAF